MNGSPLNVLVTGHRGYIGAVLVPFLQKHGHRVSGFDSDLYRDCDLLPLGFHVPEAIKDLRDVEVSDLKGFDAVVHLAALSNDPLGNLNANFTYEINHRASVRLAECARLAGVKRYLFSSSCSNYGAGSGDAMLDENAAMSPITPYGQSKADTERDVASMASESFSPIFLRNATAYGVSPRLRLDLVVNDLVGCALTQNKIELLSDGSAWRPLIHVEDICRGMLASLEAPIDLVHNQAFNIGRSCENYQIREVAQIVAKVVPGCEVTFASGASADARNYRVSCAKAESRLPGFDPKWTVEAGARQLAEAYRSVGLTADDFKGSRYRRIGTIRKRLAAGELAPDLRSNV